MGLQFYEDAHRYELDGEELPSVSEVLRFLSRECYGDINAYTLDHAADRGTQVHLATQQIDSLGECEIAVEHEGYLLAYAAFMRDVSPIWTFSEKPLADSVERFAGTPDRVGFLKGKSAIVDIKTSCAVQKTLVKAQLNAYRKLCLTNWIGVDTLWCLHLASNGKYRLYSVVVDNTEFDACLALHYASRKKHGRMKIE